MVKRILRTENALVVRTDFSDAAAWDAIRAAIQEPVGEAEFRAYVDFFDEPEYDGLTAEQIRTLVPKRSGHTFLFIVDRVALTHPDRPILVLDLSEEPGRTFRVTPSETWSVENNLSIANMSFSEFADEVDGEGIFRGYPED